MMIKCDTVILTVGEFYGGLSWNWWRFIPKHVSITVHTCLKILVKMPGWNTAEVLWLHLLAVFSWFVSFLLNQFFHFFFLWFVFLLSPHQVIAPFCFCFLILVLFFITLSCNIFCCFYCFFFFVCLFYKIPFVFVFLKICFPFFPCFFFASVFYFQFFVIFFYSYSSFTL